MGMRGQSLGGMRYAAMVFGGPLIQTPESIVYSTLSDANHFRFRHKLRESVLRSADISIVQGGVHLRQGWPSRRKSSVQLQAANLRDSVI